MKRLLLVAVGLNFLCQPAYGMNTLSKVPQEELNLLEDFDKLPAREEFKKFMKIEMHAPQAYRFLSGYLVAQQPKMMEKKFEEVIANEGKVATFAFGMVNGLANWWTGSSDAVTGVMVKGMGDETETIAKVFETVLPSPQSSLLSLSLKDMLEQELKVTKQDRDALLKKVGRCAIGTVLQFIKNNKQQVNEKILQLAKAKAGVLATILTKPVDIVLNKGTENSEFWKEFFGELAMKVYEEKK